MTPSTAGAQHGAPTLDTGDSPADAGGDLALMGQVRALGHAGGGPRCVPLDLCPMTLCA